MIKIFEKVLSWILGNLRLLGVLLGLSLVFPSYYYFLKYQERESQKSLYLKQRAFYGDIEKADGADKKPPFSLTDKMKQSLKDYEEELLKNKKKKASLFFAIDLAHFYKEQKEEKQAIELLESFQDHHQSLNLSHLLQFFLSGLYMDDKQYEKAEKTLQSLINNKKASFLHLESRLRRGICLEELGNLEEARREYNLILKEGPESFTAKLAQDYLRLLILSKKEKP